MYLAKTPDDLDQISAVQSKLIGEDDTADLPTSVQVPLSIRIVCLGIGIVNESRESQFQFVLLDLLKEALGVSSFTGQDFSQTTPCQWAR